MRLIKAFLMALGFTAATLIAAIAVIGGLALAIKYGGLLGALGFLAALGVILFTIAIYGDV